MLERLAALLAHHQSQNGTAPPRIQLTDSEAVSLIHEVAPPAATAESAAAGAEPAAASVSVGGEATAAAPTFRHPGIVAEAAAGLKALLDTELPSELEELENWFRTKAALAEKLWNGLEGEMIGGVEILRKRPALPATPEVSK